MHLVLVIPTEVKRSGGICVSIQLRRDEMPCSLCLGCNLGAVFIGPTKAIYCSARQAMTNMPHLTDLIDAVKQGDLERVRAILDLAGDLIHLRDPTGATPLHYAAFLGQQQVAELLIDRGADINSTDSHFGATPAGWAI